MFAARRRHPINHLVAHVGVGLLDGAAAAPELPENLGALLVSGGHTEILKINSITDDVRLLGSTIDDAAGEAYDKVARYLGLGYPGGPVVDRISMDGDPEAIAFPRALPDRPYDFSFSGLKTAVVNHVRKHPDVSTEDVAASFQEAVCDVLTRKAIDAATTYGIDDILIGGGVAANSRLRAMAQERAAARGIRVRVPRPGLCTDNGAMVAALGAELVQRGRTPSALDLPADSSQPITTVVA